MFNRKLPSCACISVLNKITVPTTLGTIILLVAKIPDIIKTANEIKKAIPAVQKFVQDMEQQCQTVQPQENENPDIVINSEMNEEESDMG